MRSGVGQHGDRASGWPQCSSMTTDYTTFRHWHSEIEIAVVLEGRLEIDVEKRVYALSHGEAICICDGVTHYYHKNSGGARAAIVKFTPGSLETVFESPVIADLYGCTFKLTVDARLKEIALSMLNPGLGESDRYIRFAKLVELSALLIAEPWRVSEITPVQYASGSRYLRAAQAYMAENSRGALTLNMLAEHLGLTRSYCSKYIREQTGIPFITYLNQLRVSDAEVLLLYSDMRITDIAEETGFGSIQTFNRMFKKLTGVSPRDYRKTQKMRANG